MLTTAKNKVNETIEHVRNHKKVYVVAGVAGVYLVGNLRGFKKCYEVTMPLAVEAAKTTAVDEYLIGVAKQGLIPLEATETEFHVMMGALVNAGLKTPEVAKEATEMVNEMFKLYLEK